MFRQRTKVKTVSQRIALQTTIIVDHGKKVFAEQIARSDRLGLPWSWISYGARAPTGLSWKTADEPQKFYRFMLLFGG